LQHFAVEHVVADDLPLGVVEQLQQRCFAWGQGDCTWSGGQATFEDVEGRSGKGELPGRFLLQDPFAA
jgi:hypothetical protein